MAPLTHYLWQEWRDHRAVIAGLVLAVPVLMGVAAFSLPYKAFEAALFTQITAGACLLIAMIAVCTELVPGERRRGTLGFLRRLPAGLTAPFAAKLLFYVAVAAFFLAYGWAAGGLTSRAVAGAFPWPPKVPTLFFWFFAVLAVWVFAASCGLTRGMLAIPAAIFLIVGVAAPVVPFVEKTQLQCKDWFNAGSVVLWTGGGVLTALLAFLSGGSGGRALGWCLGGAVACALPYWAEAARDVHAYYTDREPRISDAVVGPDGAFAFVNRYYRLPGYDGYGRERMAGMAPAIVDLRTGAARDVETASRPPWGTAFHSRWSQGLPQYPVAYLYGVAAYDASTGEKVDENPLPAIERAATTLRLPDGRTAWIQGGDLFVDGEAVDSGFATWASPAGFGVFQERRAYFDFTRMTRYRRRDLPLRGHQVLIRPGRWLVWKTPPGKGTEWHLLDPEGRELSFAVGLHPRDSVFTVHDDGRVWAWREGTGLRLLDPETGEALACCDMRICCAARVAKLPVHDAAGRRIYMITRLGRPPVGEWAFARLDGERFTFTAWMPGAPRLLGLVGDDAALVLVDEMEIRRVRFGAADDEVLYRVR